MAPNLKKRSWPQYCLLICICVGMVHHGQHDDDDDNCHGSLWSRWRYHFVLFFLCLDQTKKIIKKKVKKGVVLWPDFLWYCLFVCLIYKHQFNGYIQTTTTAYVINTKLIQIYFIYFFVYILVIVNLAKKKSWSETPFFLSCLLQTSLSRSFW